MAVAYVPGQVIVDDCDPFVKFLLPQFRAIRCSTCFMRTNKLIACKNCETVSYCDEVCEKIDSDRGHELECGMKCYEEFCREQPLHEVKFYLFRMYAFSTLQPDLGYQTVSLYNGVLRSFNDLTSHMEQMENDKDALQLCKEMERRIRIEDPKTEIDYRDFLEWFGIYKANVMLIMDERNMYTIGFGIYIQASVFDHACKPTAFVSHLGPKVQIRAITNIPVGQLPNIDYLGKTLNKTERRSLLLEKYNFECACEWCTSNADDSINYTNLKTMLADMIKLESYLKPEIGFDEAYDKFLEIMMSFQEMYNECDFRITNEYCRMLRIASKLSDTPDIKLKKLIQEAYDRVLVTFGEGYYVLDELKEKYPGIIE